MREYVQIDVNGYRKNNQFLKSDTKRAQIKDM